MPPKKSKLRAIDSGTRYDLTGNLRRLAREIERGELETVTDIIVVCTRTGECGVKKWMFDTGEILE